MSISETIAHLYPCGSIVEGECLYVDHAHPCVVPCIDGFISNNTNNILIIIVRFSFVYPSPCYYFSCRNIIFWYPFPLFIYLFLNGPVCHFLLLFHFACLFIIVIAVIVSVGEDRKIAAHTTSCRSVGVSFIPLIVETLGGWSNQALETIRGIGCLQSQRLGISPAESISCLFQRLAVCLWRGNPACYMGEETSY